MKRFGEKIRTLRERQGLTVRQVAASVGIHSHSHIVGIETGKHQPSPELIVKLADLFAVTADDLMRDEREVT